MSKSESISDIAERTLKEHIIELDKKILKFNQEFKRYIEEDEAERNFSGECLGWIYGLFKR